MKVGIFYTSISDWRTASLKTSRLIDFGLGVVAAGDEIVNFKKHEQKILDIDAGFILGYTLGENFRSKIIRNLKSRDIPIIYIDSNIFNYGKKDNHCYRYSVNGVYPTDGEYFLSLPKDPTKLDKLLAMHDLEIKPWRQNGNHIVILGQRTEGWNMLGHNGIKWVCNMVERVREITDRPITVRLHPGDSGHNKANVERIRKRFGHTVNVRTGGDIKDDLADAWCCVGFNSTPNCVSVIEGIPVYLDEPTNSWAKDVGFTNLEQLSDPPMPDRNEWLHKIAHIHHTGDEILQGVYWNKFKSYYKL